jgi:hypothetical protein
MVREGTADHIVEELIFDIDGFPEPINLTTNLQHNTTQHFVSELRYLLG